MKSWVNFGQMSEEEEAKTDVEIEVGRILDISKNKQKSDLPNHGSLAERRWNSISTALKLTWTN